MCLTGVDYFSTLGYQPGIAALAAGLLSPVATVVLVLVTLFGALPVYRRVAVESPHGQGSIAMLERLLSFWKGKLFVLALLGFALTDFLITMTLSAADATAHIVENPHVAGALDGHQVAITLGMLGLLAGVFLRGFGEAIGVAVALVVAYLALNLIVVSVALWQVSTNPALVTDWTRALSTSHGSLAGTIAVAVLVFPKLALGLSGFETGVAVMPHIRGDAADSEERPDGRIRGTRRLLTSAAAIMSFFLISSSFVTTLLIPQRQFEANGEANGRALAYLAHEYLGNGFGTVYDFSTVSILWFAGASALAGMLNLIPRYLPRYGMAPEWSAAVRPLVLLLTAVAFLVTWFFKADVNAQGGAYATGVLVLITSAAVAVTLSTWRAGRTRRALLFAVVSAVFVYTTFDNVVERPDGVRIAALFITAILSISFYSRVSRSTELRVTDVAFDAAADTFLRDCARRSIRLVAKEPDTAERTEYRQKIALLESDHELGDARDILFAEVTLVDPSDFASRLEVRGEVLHGQFRVLRMTSASVPNALAALALAARDRTGVIPHLYLEWTEGDPIANYLRFLLFGEGEVSRMTREVVRRSEPDRLRRPHVHVS
nr:amino acid transporter [Nocardioides mesophilus]